MVLIVNYLVNKDIIEVIGEAVGEFFPQARKQVLLVLHSF